MKVAAASAALAALAVLMFAPLAWAHAMGVSRAEYVVSGQVIEATLLFRAEELRNAESAADVVNDTRVEADGVRCDGALVSSAPDAPDGTRIIARFTCAHRVADVRVVRVHAGFLERFPSGHGHAISIARYGQRGREQLAVLAQPDVEVDLGAPPSLGLMGFVRAGIEHILTGPDHLLFLLGLVLLRRDRDPMDARGASHAREGVKALVFVLTAFTVGHSLSLAIATLGGHPPSSRIVEPLVALSVAYVGGENLFARSHGRRWMLTFSFGVVHGFAFASGLLLVGLPRQELPLALVGFNSGVELGQLGVMTLVLPPLFLLARRPRAYDVVRTVLSAGVLVSGLVWFVQRTLFAG